MKAFAKDKGERKKKLEIKQQVTNFSFKLRKHFMCVKIRILIV